MTQTGDAPLTQTSAGDIGPQELEGIKVYRKDIDIGADDKYGHWWLKIDERESYGWWPKDHVSSPLKNGPRGNRVSDFVELSHRESFASGLFQRTVSAKQTLLGVEGELNGQTTFGGTPFRDPHHFDTTGKAFDVYAKDQFVPRGVVIGQIRGFANSYSGGWSWPWGQNCHSFQNQLLNDLHLELRPAGLAP